MDIRENVVHTYFMGMGLINRTYFFGGGILGNFSKWEATKQSGYFSHLKQQSSRAASGDEKKSALLDHSTVFARWHQQHENRQSHIGTHVIISTYIIHASLLAAKHQCTLADGPFLPRKGQNAELP